MGDREQTAVTSANTTNRTSTIKPLPAVSGIKKPDETAKQEPLSARVSEEISHILNDSNVLSGGSLERVSPETAKFLKKLFCNNENASQAEFSQAVLNFQREASVADTKGDKHKLSDDGALGPRTLLAKLQEQLGGSFAFGTQQSIFGINISIPEPARYEGGFNWDMNDGSRGKYEPAVDDWKDPEVQKFIDNRWDSEKGWLKDMNNNLTAGPRISQAQLRILLDKYKCPNTEYWLKLIEEESRGVIFAARKVSEAQAQSQNRFFHAEQSGGILQINHEAHPNYVAEFRDKETKRISAEVFNPENIIKYVALNLNWNTGHWVWSSRKLAAKGIYP